MRNQLLICSSLCLIALSGCDNTHRNEHTTHQGAAQQANTSMGDQAENESDRLINQKIRQALLDDAVLSANVKTIKIITANGVVTLRGSTLSDKEKNDIGKKVKNIAGVKNVDNQIEIIRIEKKTTLPE